MTAGELIARLSLVPAGILQLDPERAAFPPTPS
jgi:hypothetical protein